MARSIVSDMIRMQIQQSITGPLMGMMSNRGSISTLSGHTSVGANAGTSGGSAGAFFADGGLMKAGRPAIVGERGPELVIPNRNSTVVSNEQLTGGGQTVVNVNVSTGVSQTVRAEIMARIEKHQKALERVDLSEQMTGVLRGRIAELRSFIQWGDPPAID